MESLKFITDATLALTGLMAVGITARILYLIIGGITEGIQRPMYLKK